MNLYMTTRWGNESLDGFERGPDGPDTNFLVRAHTIEKAAKLTNESLAYYTNNGVRGYCQHISLIGKDESHIDEAVIHGPFISHAFFNNSSYKGWSLVSEENNQWEKDSQLY